MGNVVSPGFIKLNNAELLRTQFSGIYNYALKCSNFVSQAVKNSNPLGYKGYFGDGDGSTTFTIPDGRGEFVRFWDDGAGIDVGRGIGSWQDFAIQNITGSFSVDDRSQNTSGAFYKTWTGAGGAEGGAEGERAGWVGVCGGVGCAAV